MTLQPEISQRDLRLRSKEIMDAVVARYGEYVLLRPTGDGANLVLWLAGPMMLLMGLGLGWSVVRKRGASPEEALTAEEKARLNDLLKG